MRILVCYRDREDKSCLNWLRDQLNDQFNGQISSELNCSAIRSLDVYKKKWGQFGVVLKIYEIFTLFVKLVNRRPDVLVFCINHPSYRIYKKIFRVKLIYYARTLHLFYAQSMSDRIFKRLRIPFIDDVLNNHSADFVLTIGPANKVFFSQYNRPSEIFEIGLPFIQESLKKQRLGDSSVSRRVYICTQSWDSHGFSELASNQKRLVNILLQLIEFEFNIKPILRPHPRDYTKYTESLIDVDSNFYSRIKAGDVIITGISTLALEAILMGASIVFIRLQSEDGIVSQEEFDRLGINPCTTESEVVNELRRVIDGIASTNQAKFLKATHSGSNDDWVRLIDGLKHYIQ